MLDSKSVLTGTLLPSTPRVPEMQPVVQPEMSQQTGEKQARNEMMAWKPKLSMTSK